MKRNSALTCIALLALFLLSGCGDFLTEALGEGFIAAMCTGTGAPVSSHGDKIMMTSRTGGPQTDPTRCIKQVGDEFEIIFSQRIPEGMDVVSIDLGLMLNGAIKPADPKYPADLVGAEGLKPGEIICDGMLFSRNLAELDFKSMDGHTVIVEDKDNGCYAVRIVLNQSKIKRGVFRPFMSVTGKIVQEIGLLGAGIPFARPGITIKAYDSTYKPENKQEVYLHFRAALVVRAAE